jgi:hypothetical protein
MYGDYLVLCGMVWSQFGKEDAGLELVRALSSPDADVRVLARTLLEQSQGGSKALIGEALAREEISASTAALCAFGRVRESDVCRFGGEGWDFAGAA